LRVRAAAAAAPGYLAVVTETGGLISVTESAGRIGAGLARRYGPSLVLLEHPAAPESGEGLETLDLVRIGADRSPRWSRLWPARRRTRVTPGWNGGWPFTGTRSSAGPRAGSIGVTTITADCSWRRATWCACRLRRRRACPGPGMAQARSGGPRAWPPADRPRPGAPSSRPRRRRARRLRRGDGQPGGDGLTRPSPAGYIWPWRTGPAGS
jgi:hypothetical protein